MPVRLVGKVVSESLDKGNQLAHQGKYDLARREYRTAEALNTQCLEAQLGLAYLCFVQSQWDLALQHYVRALTLDPGSADAHYGLARVLCETDNFDDAIPEFRKTLDINPAFDEAREALTTLGTAAWTRCLETLTPSSYI